MANLQRMLGTMLATRLGGRGGLAGLAGTALLGGLGGKAWLAALAYLAYRAYRDRGPRDGGRPERRGARESGDSEESETGRFEDAGRFEDRQSFPDRPPAAHDSARNRTSPREADPVAAGIAGIAGVIGNVIDNLSRGGRDGRSRSFGDRIGDLLDPRPAPEDAVGDEKALLLIRAMITAAHSDGPINAQERSRIISKLEEAGADDDDRRLIDRELQNPASLDSLLREVRDEATARQFYLASRVAVGRATPTQRSYLEYLRQRLKLTRDDVETTERMAGTGEER